MIHIIAMLCVLGTVFISAFFRFSPKLWTIFIGVVLLLCSPFLPASFLIISWIIFLLAAIFANASQLRQKYLLKILPKIKKQMPTISQTEREALEAGHTWWEKELFGGNPNWQHLLAIPTPQLSSAEQDFLNNQVNTLCAMLSDWEIINKDKDLPQPVWDYLKKEKFFGMVIPKEYGGLGFSALAHSSVIIKIATRSISAAVNTMVPNSLGPAELLLHYGTEEQKSFYLPKLAEGKEIPCFALTAPDAGSDAGAIPDVGIICRGNWQGQEIIGIKLNWDKRYITLAPIATVLGLAFQLYDPDHLLGKKTELGITLCLIPTAHDGVEIGNRHYPLQLTFMNGPTRGKDVFIPLDWIIGGPSMAGQGWKMLMECLSIGRSISLPALATACGKMTYRYTGAYARIRKQFNVPIAAFEGVEEALGYIAGYTYLLEATRIMTAGAVDQKIKPAIASAIAKYHMTEMSRKVIANAMDVHAGHMIQIGPRNFLAYPHISIPISITVEGANILTRNLIIFGQGAIRCHPYLLKEIAYITTENTDIAKLDHVLLSHVGYFASNLLRSFAYGLTGGLFISSNIKNKSIRKYHKQISRMSTALALLADFSLMILGGSLKRRERLSARLGDIMSQLYMSSAVLKYYYDHQQPETDVEYVCWCLQYCLYKMQIAIDEVLNNFPNRFLARIIHFVIFPFGRAYKAPKDYLHKQLVSKMLVSSDIRERLTQHCYLSTDENDLTWRMDKALLAIDNIDPIWKKLQKSYREGKMPSWYDFSESLNYAVENGILSTNEAAQLQDYERLRREIIKVDEFSFDLQTVLT
jgi:acyl-CoA dehydrogenase